MDLFGPTFLFRAVMVLFAITIHEYMHARIALLCGDPTAKMEGRITLNPIAHLDPIGAICLLFAPIGWGKPVPVNPFNLRHPVRDDVLISIAGPVSNLVAATAFGLALRFLPLSALATDSAGGRLVVNLVRLLLIGLHVNLGLAVFNMLPLFPLDGSHVLGGLLRGKARSSFDDFSRYAPGVLLGLILFDHFTNLRILSFVLGTPIEFLSRLILGV